MRIKKKQSLSKIPEKVMSATTADRFLPADERRLAPLEVKREMPLFR
jgi:hypothetical protein